MGQRAPARRLSRGVFDRRCADKLRRILAAAASVLVFSAAAVYAQDESQEAPPDFAAPASPVVSMTDDEARKALAATLPPDATPQQRLDFLLRQRAAARIVGDQAALIRALDELADGRLREVRSGRA